MKKLLIGLTLVSILTCCSPGYTLKEFTNRKEFENYVKRDKGISINLEDSYYADMYTFRNLLPSLYYSSNIERKKKFV